MSRVARSVAVALLVVLCSGCAGGPSAQLTDYFDRWAAAREEQPTQVGAGLRRYAPAAATDAATVAPPRRVALPSVGVSSRLEHLGLADDGAIETPRRWQRAGWYQGGPRPGDPGSAVILGHVDSTSGPAVFYGLRDLAPGDPIRVTRGDGSVAVFTVDRVEQHRKTRFPTDDVYYPTPEPTLRLVTCGGAFDADARSYVDNVVVFASLRSIRA